MNHFEFPAEGNYPPDRECPRCGASCGGNRASWEKQPVDQYYCNRCEEIEKQFPVLFKWIKDVLRLRDARKAP